MRTAKNSIISATKALGAGKPVTAEQLAKINRFSNVQLTAEQVYVREYLVAHNAIDRDNERFDDALLADFAATLPGKGFFVEGHPGYSKQGPGSGLFFDARVQEMTPEEFVALTGEAPKLPEGMLSVKVLIGSSYILKLDSNSDTLANIDGGIYRFVSIGFKAPLFEVTDDRGNCIYWEYRPKGEAREGSLVWLGAQPGAQAIKQVGITKEEGGSMKELLEKMKSAFSRAFTEGGLIDEIKAMLSEKDAEIASLKPKAADGEAYRKNLVADALKYGVMIDEVPTDEAGQKSEEVFLSGLPIDRLKAMRDKFEARAREKCPDKFTFKGKDISDSQAKGGDDDEKAKGALAADAKKRAEAQKK